MIDMVWFVGGVIEPVDAEWCLVDDCFINKYFDLEVDGGPLARLLSFIHILNVIITSQKNIKVMKW